MSHQIRALVVEPDGSIRIETIDSGQCLKALFDGEMKLSGPDVLTHLTIWTSAHSETEEANYVATSICGLGAQDILRGRIVIAGAFDEQFLLTDFPTGEMVRAELISRVYQGSPVSTVGE